LVSFAVAGTMLAVLENVLMTSEELIELLAERPFKPLRLHLSDGRIREIRHSEMAIVAEDAIAIGVPRDEGSRRAYKITHCSIQNIVEVEPLDVKKPPGDNGPASKKERGR
jgi:hypothetical protein